jgi:hypothetical protein
MHVHPRAGRSQAAASSHRVTNRMLCMPCMQVSSDAGALGPVTAVQGGFGVWGRPARSGEIWRDLARSGGVGPWFDPGLASRRTRPEMVPGPGCVSAREACCAWPAPAKSKPATKGRSANAATCPEGSMPCSPPPQPSTLTVTWRRSLAPQRGSHPLTAAGVLVIRESATEPWGLVEMWIEERLRALRNVFRPTRATAAELEPPAPAGDLAVIAIRARGGRGRTARARRRCRG